MTISPGERRATNKRLVRHSPLIYRLPRNARNIGRLRGIARITQAIHFIGGGLPVIGCQIAFIGTRIKRIKKDYSVEVLRRYENNKPRFSIALDSMSGWVGIALFILSVGCAVRCFTVSRRYRLFERKEPPRSTSARCTVRDLSTSPSTPGFLMRFWRDTRNEPLVESTTDITTAASTENNSKGPATSNTSEHVWELAVWDPSKQLILFFCFFNPVHLILLWYHPLSLKHLILVATIAFQLFLLHRAYAGYVADKSIIHGEVFNEYSKKFVEPRLFPYKRDVATSTHPDIVQVEVHTPYGKPNKSIHYPSVPASNRIRSLIEDEWNTPSKSQKGMFKKLPMSPIKNIQLSPAKGFRPANSWSVNASTNHFRPCPNTKSTAKHL
ncbi:hypothetical protein PORY_001897 [Pneumocystis oryctolagi]|uniref:Uncharacterized protein n=1 Tax=Pneumocystis oryctolagi TaxID=42067 RepID=A0ACB7CDA4_9ASCO|nr:hypothetical protein PORY_001897 [Pneumocystis oryctolagi]